MRWSVSLGGVLNQLTVFTLQMKDWSHHPLLITLIHKASLLTDLLLTKFAIFCSVQPHHLLPLL